MKDNEDVSQTTAQPQFYLTGTWFFPRKGEPRYLFIGGSTEGNWMTGEFRSYVHYAEGEVRAKCSRRQFRQWITRTHARKRRPA